jgi:medium-chain acyl-[acyl-carrier-protein] hydrolase
VKPDDELLADIVALNSMPPDALAEAELLALMLPVLRADLELAETYRYRDAPPLGCPITAVGGLDDEETRGERLSEWQRHTRATFHEYNLPGDHFFVHSREADVNAILTAVVAANSRATISGASLAPPAAQAHASREQR